MDVQTALRGVISESNRILVQKVDVDVSHKHLFNLQYVYVFILSFYFGSPRYAPAILYQYRSGEECTGILLSQALRPFFY